MIVPLFLAAMAASTACLPDPALDAAAFKVKLTSPSGGAPVEAELSLASCSASKGQDPAGAPLERRSYREKTGRLALILIGAPGAAALEAEAVLSAAPYFAGGSGWAPVGAADRESLLKKGFAVSHAAFTTVLPGDKLPIVLAMSAAPVAR